MLPSFQLYGEFRCRKSIHEGSTDETLTVVRDKLATDPLLDERTCISGPNSTRSEFAPTTSRVAPWADSKRSPPPLALDIVY